MGVQVRLVLHAPDEPAAMAAAGAAFDRIAQLEDVMSDYRPTSELMRLATHEPGTVVPVSTDLFVVLEKAQELARRSDGAFDVTVGPFVRLWRQARRSGRLPTESELTEASARVGWQKLQLEAGAQTVVLSVAGMQLDLGGIGKGYAADEAMAVLRRHGIESASIQIGGDVIVSGAPPGRDGWPLIIVNAPPDRQHISLIDSAISSSGDLHQFVEVDGKRYSHIVDPRTGLGLTNGVAVTVVAPSGMLSDGLATLLNVVGCVDGPELAEGFGARAECLRAE